MRSFKLEHFPLGLLNVVWGTHSARCCGGGGSAFVLEGGWVELIFRSHELLRSARYCAYWVFTIWRFPQGKPHISHKWKVKIVLTIWPERTTWGLTELYAYRNFSIYTSKGLCNGWAIQNMRDGVALLHVGAHPQRPTRSLRGET